VTENTVMQVNENVLPANKVNIHGPADFANKGRFEECSNDVTEYLNALKSNIQPSRQFYCRFPSCRFSSTNAIGLQNHVQLTHKAKRANSAKEVMPCPQCNFKTKYEVCLDMHTRIIHDHKIILLDKKCQHCAMAFETEGRLENHLRIVHNKSLREFKCELCAILAVFDTKEQMEEHRKKLHPVENLEEATNNIKKMSDEAQKIIEQHGKSLLFPKLPLHQCTQCSRILCSEMDLEEHNMEQHIVLDFFNSK